MKARGAFSGGWSDRRILLVLGGVMIAVLAGVGFIARSADDTDTRPSTYNTGSAGAKAAYLVLEGLGRKAGRWDQPLGKLAGVPAEHTTLVLADPQLAVSERKGEAADLQRFLERGGRVLLTGTEWASLLPGGAAGGPGALAPKFCYTTPEGPGALAQAGSVEMMFHGAWTAQEPRAIVEQRCLDQPVVVRYAVGKGEAVWWGSSSPLSNAGLKKGANLQLLLASLYGHGEERQVLFDEYVQEVHGGGEHLFAGLPLTSILLQVITAMGLLVWSFSRRKGPLRMPVELPRSSPVEFATSMGDLYEKAGATDAATEAARRRLLRTLQREAGVAQTAMAEGPKAIAEALGVRLGGSWNDLAAHLQEARDAQHASVQPRSALALVRALGEDEERVRNALRRKGTGSEVPQRTG